MTQPSTARQPGLATTVALYTAARLGLLAAIAALLVLAGAWVVQRRA